FSEIDSANNTCDIDPVKQTNTWDVAVGGEFVFEKGRSHVFAWAGARESDRAVPAIAARPIAGDPRGPTFYRDDYVRYDTVKHIAGPCSVQLQGFHRHRSQPDEYADVWNEGENYTAFQWSPHFNAVFGYESLGRAGCRTRPDPTQPDVTFCHYFSGG